MLVIVWSWAKVHWKLVLSIVALVGCYGAGYAHARHNCGSVMNPDSQTVKQHTTSDVAQSASKVDKQTSTAKVDDTKRTQRAVKIVTHTERRPPSTPGCPAIQVTDRTTTIGETVDAKHDLASVSAGVLVDNSAEHTKTLADVTTITVARRDWKAGILLGAQLQSPATIAANPLGSFVAGATIERRLSFIPIPGLERGWIGLWGIAGPDFSKGGKPGARGFGGVSLAVEF